MGIFPWKKIHVIEELVVVFIFVLRSPQSASLWLTEKLMGTVSAQHS